MQAQHMTSKTVIPHSNARIEFQSSLSKESSDLFLAPYSKENILFPNLGRTFPNVKFEKEFGKNPSRNDHFRVIL